MGGIGVAPQAPVSIGGSIQRGDERRSLRIARHAYTTRVGLHIPPCMRTLPRPLHVARAPVIFRALRSGCDYAIS